MLNGLRMRAHEPTQQRVLTLHQADGVHLRREHEGAAFPLAREIAAITAIAEQCQQLAIRNRRLVAGRIDLVELGMDVKYLPQDRPPALDRLPSEHVKDDSYGADQPGVSAVG